MVTRFRKPSAEAVHNLITWIQSRAFNDAGVIIGIARSDALFTVQQIKRRGIQRQLRSCQRKRMIYVNDVAEYTRELAAVIPREIDDFAARLLPGVD